MFGEKTKKTRTPLVARDHPETEFCDQDQIKQYQTTIGQLIWLAGSWRFDIAVHIMTMYRFRQLTMQYFLTNPEKQLPWELKKELIRLSDVIIQD